MANIAIFKIGQVPCYLTSVDSSEYAVDVNVGVENLVPKDPDVIFNPNITAVQNVPLKYWKRSGNNVVEMTLAEKQAVDAQLLQARKDSVTDPSNADLKDILTALIKVINIRLSNNQKITKQELIDAIKAEIV